MKFSTIAEVLMGAHLTVYVKSPFLSRGGIMLVAPPASLKSLVVQVIEEYPNALVMSDLTTKQLIVLRDEIAARRYVTLGFTEFEKIYQRHDSTANNIEGNLKAMMEEGFTRGSFEDQRMVTIKARCLIIGAITSTFYAKRYTEWRDSGFARRFLWVHFVLADPRIIVKAIHDWERVNANGLVFGLPTSRTIPFDCSKPESHQIERWLKHQPGIETPLILMKKILSVLKWRYKRIGEKPEKAMQTLHDFSEALGSSGAELEI